jgi:ADP-ribose pyrophosphatase YjhB (NUDIX family)
MLVRKTVKKTTVINNKSNINICNNCGKPGHLFHQCKMPITSIGIITFRLKEDGSPPEYLLIRRKETLGYIDFMRGKYSVYNKDYIMNMLKQMTNYEKNRLCTGDFNLLWKDIWGDSKYNNQYKSEEIISREKYKMLLRGIYENNIQDNSYEIKEANLLYTLQNLIEESNCFQSWEEPEWGFPKGRRNNQENDYDCAIREFKEETGYNPVLLTYIQNVLPLEEIFLGSNYKSYKHKYFLMYMDYNESLKMGNFQVSEVSKVEWKSYEECISCFRPYNLEKIRILTNIDNGIKNVYIQDSLHP